MSFILKIKQRSKNNLVITDKEIDLKIIDGSILFISANKCDVHEHCSENEILIIIGDLVTDKCYDEVLKEIRYNDISNLGGFYYAIYINNQNNIIKIFSCIFNILPVYYVNDGTNIIVSSKAELICKITGNKTINNKYILERILFNYSFLDETIFQQIKLLPSNHYIEIDDRCNIKKHFDITNYFVSEPRKGKKVLEEIAFNFIDSTAKYFPDEEVALSFTSGFDGRTLVAIGKKLNSNIFTYSFGSPDSIDITFPFKQHETIGIEFKSFILGDKYVKEKSLRCGLDIIEKTEGNSSFGRAHYRYASEELSKRVRHIITGNFGSELFRAFHNPGVVISQEMISFFNSDNDKWIDNIITSDKLKYLNIQSYKPEFEQLIEELKHYKNEYKGLVKSRCFYKYIFEEVFRKYFGPEIVMQNYFMKNRSPYLDPVFIKYLLTTNYAGVYSKFFTHNPVKRFKGQLPYSYIINKAYPPLMNLITGKGYYPIDLLTIGGKIRLIKSRLLKRSNQINDAFSVHACFLYNKKYYSEIKVNQHLFNKKEIEKYFSVNRIGNIDDIIHIISLNYYLNKING